MTEQLPLLFWRDVMPEKTSRSRKPASLVPDVAYLYVGSLGEPVAGLYLSHGKRWHIAECLLPGLKLTRRQGPLEEMRKVVAGDVVRWLALLGRPMLRLTDGAGI